MFVGSTGTPPPEKTRVSVPAEPLAGRQGGREAGPLFGTCICQIQLPIESNFPPH